MLLWLLVKKMYNLGLLDATSRVRILWIILYSATSKSHHSLLSTQAYYKIWPTISQCKIVQEDNWLSSQEIKILMQNDILQNKNVLRN